MRNIRKSEVWSLLNAKYVYWQKKRVLVKSLQAWLKNRLENEIGNPNQILEIGCGKGHTLKQFSKIFRNFTFVGIDNKALKRNKHYNERLQLLKADILNMPFENSSFDILLSMKVFHYIGYEDKERERALIECWKILNEGGRFYMAECFLNQNYPKNKETDSNNRDLIKLAEFRKMAENIGFKFIKLQFLGVCPVNECNVSFYGLSFERLSKLKKR